MNDNIFLLGKNITLRTFNPDDALLFCSGENDPDVRETLFLAYPANVDQIRDRIVSQINSGNAVVLTIADKYSDKAIGQTAFFRIDPISHSAIFYIALLDKSKWSQGLGTEATQLMIKYGFDTLNLHRIQLHVFADNHAAIHIYKKIGFKKEGILREAMYHHGKYCDFLVMGCLKNEWIQPSI
ncbi:MAG: GNAT family N-acetyltransferase [Candidatus Marinimicrobia bacterium]|nr:GNAT family N-acetyltransferase [Candidatus Neomarinimicrobiota bacterium]